MFQLTERTRDNSASQPQNRLVHKDNSFFAQVDNLFDQLIGTFAGDHHNHTYRDTSRDFVETESEIQIRIDAPGFEPTDFQIEVKEQVLRVVAERKTVKDDKTYVERRLARALTLPASVNLDKVEANYRNGVLELRLPKTEQAKWRKIAVSGS